MGILNFYYTCEPVNSVCAKVHDRLMAFLIEQSKVQGPHQVVAEVDASDPRVATGEVWKELTENFRKPMVVRGLFKGAPALEKWASWEYFADRFGDDKYSFLIEDNSERVVVSPTSPRTPSTRATSPSAPRSTRSSGSRSSRASARRPTSTASRTTRRATSTRPSDEREVRVA